MKSHVPHDRTAQTTIIVATPAGSVSASERVERWFQYFIPPSVANDPERRGIARRLVATGFLSLLLVPIFSIAYSVLGAPDLALLVLASAPLYVGSAWVLRYTGSVDLAAVLVLGTLLAFVTSVAAYTGGPESPAAAWIAMVTLGAAVTTTHRFVAFWALLCVVCLGGLHLAGHLGVSFTYALAPGTETWFATVSNVTLLGTLLFEALTLTSAQSAVLRELRVGLQGLALERDRAESANQAKSQFLARMSHELRTPLTSILGYAELIREERGASDPDLDDDLEIVERSSRHLLGLINGVLDLSRVEAGGTTAVPESFDVDELLRELEARLRPIARAQGTELNIVSATGIRMFSDRRLVDQSLLNLLGNAVKFTPNGVVRLTVAPGRCIRFVVEDTGIGMSRDELLHAFEPFHQAASSNASPYPGTGLGLTLVRGFATLLGGSVEARSTLGEGSTFVLELPAAIADPQSLTDTHTRARVRAAS